jgi:hypothetical protein
VVDRVVVVDHNVPVGLDVALGLGVALGLDVALGIDVVVRRDGASVGQRSIAATIAVAVAAPETVVVAPRNLPGASGVARENGPVQQPQDAARLLPGQPLGVIGQQPAERCRPEAGEERLDRPERHVDHGHDQEQRLPRGRNGRRRRVSLRHLGLGLRRGRRRVGAEQVHQRAQVPGEDIGPRGDQRLVQIERGQEDLGPARGVLLVGPRGGGFAPLDQRGVLGLGLGRPVGDVVAPPLTGERDRLGQRADLGREPGDLGRLVVDSGPGDRQAGAQCLQLLRRGFPP